MPQDEKLTDGEVQAGLDSLPGWELFEGALRRRFTFKDFPDALTFVVRVGFTAEAADHHPEILVQYKRVTLTFVTHSAGGLTAKDFAGAARASATAAAIGGA